MFGSWRLGAQSSLFSLVGEQVVSVGTTRGLSCVRHSRLVPVVGTRDQVAAWKRGLLLRVREGPPGCVGPLGTSHCSPSAAFAHGHLDPFLVLGVTPVCNYTSLLQGPSELSV